jgi:hypothetical protein
MAFEIPAAIQTLLKNLEMTDDSRPTADLFITGAPRGTDLHDPETWSTWRTFVGSGKTYGNMTGTTDNKAVIIYVESGSVKLAFADSVREVLDGTKTFDTANAITLTTGLVDAQTSIDLIDGKLHACITYISGELKAAYWRDSDGRGLDMAWVSTIDPDLSSTSSFDPQIGLQPSMIHKLPGGAYVVIVPRQYGVVDGLVACYSTNQGETWTRGASIGGGLGYHLGMCGSKSFLIMGDTSFLIAYLVSSGHVWMVYLTNNGATRTDIDFTADWNGISKPWYASFITVYDSTYICRYLTAWVIEIRKLKAAIPTVDNLDSVNDWELVKTIDFVDNTDNVIHHFTATEDALIVQHALGSLISGAGTFSDTVVLPIKSVVVDRSKGGASQAVVILDNTDGIYAPDSTGIWAHIIWFNKEMQIKLGYGATQQLVFTGLIDTIFMSTYPPELTIKGRDYSKLALDQQPQDTFYEGYIDEPRYAFTYYNKTPEYIFRDMALQASWLSGAIHTDVTGITLGQFDTGHEKIADCFQRLCELTGWEWFTDEIGHVYFRAARDPSAVKVYTFTEGVDIFSLDYAFDDDELYRTIVVWSGDENRDVIKASGVWPAADYNNVLPKKTMIVNASDIVTDQAGAEAMVLALSNGMTPKVREVNFVAVGNPYLQIGDVIQVLETTTWISEHYRITEISHQMNSQGSPIFGTGLKCYHFAYGE